MPEHRCANTTDEILALLRRVERSGEQVVEMFADHDRDEWVVITRPATERRDR